MGLPVCARPGCRIIVSKLTRRFSERARAPASARIVIFEHRLGKTRGANAERGEVAYEITLSPAGEDTAIAVVNSRIADDFAERMKNDVHRWAAGETACGPQPAWTVKAAAGDTDPAGGKPAPKPARALAR